MEVRAPTDADVPAVREVVAAVEQADGDEYGYWSRFLGRRHGQRLLLGGRVTEDEEGLTGLALVREDDTLVMVHPRAEGRGIGTALRSWAEKEAVRRGHRQHRQFVVEETYPARALAAAGYVARRSMLRMAVDLRPGVDRPEWPEGVEARPFRGEDASGAHALDERAFADDPHFVSQPDDDWRVNHLNEDVDLGLSRPFALAVSSSPSPSRRAGTTWATSRCSPSTRRGGGGGSARRSCASS